MVCLLSGVWCLVCLVSGVWCAWCLVSGISLILRLVKLASDYIATARTDVRFNDTIVTVDESRRLAACMMRVSMTKAATQTAVTRMVGR